MIPLRAYIALGLITASFLSGWHANGWRLGERAAQLEAAAEHERAEAFRWVASEQKRSAATMAVADTQALLEVRREQEEADRLRDCITAGAGCGLRVKVTRAAAQCTDVPEASATPGMGDRASEWAELDAGSQQAYFALRDRIPRLEQALMLCVAQRPK